MNMLNRKKECLKTLLSQCIDNDMKDEMKSEQMMIYDEYKEDGVVKYLKFIYTIETGNLSND